MSIIISKQCQSGPNALREVRLFCEWCVVAVPLKYSHAMQMSKNIDFCDLQNALQIRSM